MAVVWRAVGYTEYNDPPPGAGNLSYGGFAFAELGTATRSGVATRTGNLARAFSYPGEVPMGTVFTFYAGPRLVYARKEDRGYGQGGDGTHSDPSYAIDLYDGSAHGLPNLPGALGLRGKGNLWVMWGEWRKGDPLPAGVPGTPTLVSHPSGIPIVSSKDPPDHSPKVLYCGKLLGAHGSHLRGQTALMGQLRTRYVTPRIDERPRHVNA